MRDSEGSEHGGTNGIGELNLGPGGISVNLGKEECGPIRAIFLDSALEAEKLD